MDPDEHRLEIEAKYPNNEMRDEMVERCKDTVNRHLGMYGSDTNKRKMY